jgi:hypothetical protein
MVKVLLVSFYLTSGTGPPETDVLTIATDSATPLYSTKNNITDKEISCQATSGFYHVKYFMILN